MSLWALIFGNNTPIPNNNVTYIFNSVKINQKKFYLENLKTIFFKNIDEIYMNPWDDNDKILKEKLSNILSSIIIYYMNGSSHFYTSFNEEEKTTSICLNLEDIESIHINFTKPLTNQEEKRLFNLFN